MVAKEVAEVKIEDRGKKVEDNEKRRWASAMRVGIVARVARSRGRWRMAGKEVVRGRGSKWLRPWDLVGA